MFRIGTVARLAITRTNAVPELRNLDSGPVPLGQSAKDTAHHGRLANVPRVTAYYNNHLFIVAPLR
jgi:hypothetical protein